jgi:hypothetical protein
MGTRTWSRRGVLTAAGRRRAGLEAIDIFGNPIPDRAPVAPPVVPPAPAPAPQANSALLTGTNKAAVEKSQRLLQNAPLNINLPVEEMYALDANGKVLFHNVGTKHAVSGAPPASLPQAEQNRLRRAQKHVTHNHPLFRPLSDADVTMMIANNNESIEARTIPLKPKQRAFINIMLQEMLNMPDAFGGTGSPKFVAAAKQIVEALLANPNALNFSFTAAQSKSTINIQEASVKAMLFQNMVQLTHRYAANFNMFRDVNKLIAPAIAAANDPSLSARTIKKWSEDAMEMVAQVASVIVALESYNNNFGTNITYGIQMN